MPISIVHLQITSPCCSELLCPLVLTWRTLNCSPISESWINRVWYKYHQRKITVLNLYLPVIIENIQWELQKSTIFCNHIQWIWCQQNSFYDLFILNKNIISVVEVLTSSIIKGNAMQPLSIYLKWEYLIWTKSKGLIKPLKALKSPILCFRYCSSHGNQHYTRRIIQKV